MLEVNEYFDGKVKSIGFQTETLPATLGVMEPGEYQFNTSKQETITIVSGSLTVKLPHSEQWQDYPAGESFIVAANEKFQLRVSIATAYLCIYQ